MSDACSGRPACEFACWSAWSGSPEMIVHVARTAAAAVAQSRAVAIDAVDGTARPRDDAQAARVRISVFVREDVETFADPDELLRLVTPEALEHFERIEIDAHGEQLFARVVIARSAGRRAGVELVVWSSAEETQDEVVIAARVIARSVQRGFRRYLGSTSGSANLGEEFRGRAARFSHLIESFAPYVLGAAMGGAVVVSIGVLFPHSHVPQGAYLGLMAA